jgi:outer membrane protein OmpA-like peptidoglycan-associated protein
MRKILTLGTIVLGCSLAMMGQTSSYSDQSQSGTSTDQAQPTYQAQPAPGYTQGQSGQMQPEEQQGQVQTAPGSMAGEEQSNSALQSENQKTTVQGCLSQGPAGSFMLADAAGNQYKLNDSSARLDQFVGQEIRVSGFASAAGETNPGAISSQAPSGSQELNGSMQQINVTKVRKVADTGQSSSVNQPYKQP